jgi:hypothetical protein
VRKLMKPTTVDAFVKARVLPEFRPIVAIIRDLMKEYSPDIRETISYGIPSYRAARIIAVISPTKKDITLAFSRGAKFEDKYGLLKGTGKVSKHVKFKSATEVNKTVLRYYIKQAQALEAK